MSQKETWSGADDYDYFMGRWSRKIAQLFSRWLNPTTQMTWLDIGCGTGALTQDIITHYAPHRVYAIDPSWNFVHHVQQGKGSFDIQCLVSFADAIPLNSELCDFVVSGLMLNFTPDPIAAVREMARVTKSGGIVAAYVWDYADKMQWLRYFWDAALTVDSSAAQFDEGRRFPLCQPDNLINTFVTAGLHEVAVVPLDTPSIFDNFTAYWKPFLSGAFPAPQYLKNLPQEKQNALRDALIESLPVEDDGSIHLIARAWAVRGIVP